MSRAKTPCRLLLDGDLDGAWNMAVDEMLLAGAEREGGCVWRFYGWRPATLSLGYFQSYADRQGHRPSLACPIVRRASGGGAILHHHELTYSVVLPSTHPLARNRLDLYRAVHRTMIDLLREAGHEASLCGEGIPSTSAASFLCFQRRAPGDVLLGSGKILGSAQRRTRGAVLQHGSLLWERSPFAPELAGVNDLTRLGWPLSRVRDQWLGRLVDALAMDWVEDELTPPEREQARIIRERKFGHEDWNVWRGRRPSRDPL